MAKDQPNSVITESDYNELSASDLTFERLNFYNCGLKLKLDFVDEYFDKIAASLLVPYLFNPQEAVNEFYRIIKPGGFLLVSSMRPDSDISLIFTNYVQEIRSRKMNKLIKRIENS